MPWHTFEVFPPATPAAVDDQLRRQYDLALATHLPICPEVAVLRRARFDKVRFFFSGEASELFKTLVQFHGGRPCRRPAASRHTVTVVPARD